MNSTTLLSILTLGIGSTAMCLLGLWMSKRLMPFLIAPYILNIVHTATEGYNSGNGFGWQLHCVCAVSYCLITGIAAASIFNVKANTRLQYLTGSAYESAKQAEKAKAALKVPFFVTVFAICGYCMLIFTHLLSLSMSRTTHSWDKVWLAAVGTVIMVVNYLTVGASVKKAISQDIKDLA